MICIKLKWNWFFVEWERAGVDGRLIFPTFCIMLIDYSITLYGECDGSFGGDGLCQTTLLHSSQQFSNCKMKIFFEAEKKIDLKFPDGLSNMCMRVCSQKRSDNYNGDKIIKLSSIGLIDILCAAILFHGLLFFPKRWPEVWKCGGDCVLKRPKHRTNDSNLLRLKKKVNRKNIENSKTESRCSFPAEGGDHLYEWPTLSNRHHVFALNWVLFTCCCVFRTKKMTINTKSIRHGK